MKLVMKEGWLVLDMIYSHGRERWTFSEHQPDYVEEAFDAASNASIPGKVKRIIYCEADNAEIEAETAK